MLLSKALFLRQRSEGDPSELSDSECDQVGSSVEVSQREVRKLMDAHVKYGHRNFRSLAKALNLRMPAKVPFCQACVEAKATRHPKSHSPFPPRALAVRPGFRLHFDPFGPFADRLSDGTYYGFLIVDAYSRVMWLDTMATLKEWFPRLRALLARIEAEKGGSCVVSELACDSAPMFKDNHEFRMFAEKKGIVLLFSPPYTQKLNSVVERPIRTLCEMAVAMSRHANTPRRFMNFAMKFATKLLNRLFRRMPDGTDDVPLWRYKGSKVPLHLDRFHPFGCAVEAVLPPRLQTRFGPKTTSCIYMGYDDSALSYILATLPRFGFLHTAHAIFDDTGFPCRKIDSVWKDEASFDADISDPLAPWLGSGNLGEGQLSGYQPNIEVQNQEPGEAPAAVSSVPNVTARTRSVQMPARAVPTVQNPLRRSAWMATVGCCFAGHRKQLCPDY